jgi:hypothetical protein
MTKAKLHETVLELCKTHKANEKLTAALSELTKPKVGGASDVTDYTVFDGEAVKYIFCTYHKKWEPVAAENEEGELVSLFVEDAKSKNGFRRYCAEGEAQWKEAAKVFNTSKAAIMTDVLDEKLTGSEAKEQIDALQAARDEHPARTDGLGSDEKPE